MQPLAWKWDQRPVLVKLARLSLSLIVLKVTGRFEYIPAYIGVKRKHCGQISTLTHLWHKSTVHIMFASFEKKDSYHRLRIWILSFWGNDTNGDKHSRTNKLTCAFVKCYFYLWLCSVWIGLLGSVWLLPFRGDCWDFLFLTRPLGAGRCKDRNPKVVSGHCLYQSLVPSLLLVA